jgi:hypothetical protein
LAVASVLFSDVWFVLGQSQLLLDLSRPAWSAVSWVGESLPTWPCSD